MSLTVNDIIFTKKHAMSVSLQIRDTVHFTDV